MRANKRERRKEEKPEKKKRKQRKRAECRYLLGAAWLVTLLCGRQSAGQVLKSREEDEAQQAPLRRVRNGRLTTIPVCSPRAIVSLFCLFCSSLLLHGRDEGGGNGSRQGKPQTTTSRERRRRKQASRNSMTVGSLCGGGPIWRRTGGSGEKGEEARESRASSVEQRRRGRSSEGHSRGGRERREQQVPGLFFGCH